DFELARAGAAVSFRLSSRWCFLVDGSCSTHPSSSKVARSRETDDLCKPTCWAISVTPTRGSSVEKQRSTSITLCTTELRGELTGLPFRTDLSASYAMERDVVHYVASWWDKNLLL